MERVLLLNASYEPLCVVTSRRALALIIKGRVEAACGDLLEMQGVSHTLRIPTVIRLRRYINVPRRGARWSRQAVFQRDNHTCGYCGIRAGEKQRNSPLSRSDFTIDHILPISRGGKNTWTNTVCACPVCNQRKGNRTPHEANMKLGWEPKMPRVTYLVASGQIPASWKIYLEVQS
ncbi:MAG: HNH endonuclease [Anaerolineae bacterium]|nr:HNH endonuclease [Anaerolineae bacterium]